MSLDSLFDSLKAETLPGIWSKGVALAREKAVLVDSRKAGECILRVQLPGRPVSPRVSVWPDDDDVHCDCGDRVSPCAHVVAAVVALKNDWTQGQGEVEKTPLVQLQYRFTARDGALAFERVIVRSAPGTKNSEQILSGSLVSLIGGIGSGRVAVPAVPTTRTDFRIDETISQIAAEGLTTRGMLDRRMIAKLFEGMRGASGVLLDGVEVTVQSQPVKVRAILEDVPGGVKLIVQRESASEARRDFINGAVFADGVLRPVQPISNIVRDSSGRVFRESEFSALVVQLLPVLERETELDLKTRKLPSLERMAPRMILDTMREPTRSDELLIVAKLVYGNPPIAEVIEGKLDLLQTGKGGVIPLRDEAAEQALIRELQSDIHLKPRQLVRLTGTDAIKFLSRTTRWERQGAAADQFALQGELIPQLSGTMEGLTIKFSLPGGGQSKAEPRRVMTAWREGEKLVPLIDGGWATIPESWLNVNIERLEAFLNNREYRETPKRKLPLLEQIQLAEFCVETGGTLSDDLSALREKFVLYKGIPEQKLPSDLRAELRGYQRVGVNWLGFLRELGLGAILADDMGLGKTLQALCALRGRTLIVAPTSVLPSWEEQIRGFRPGLRLNIFYGQSRKFNPTIDVTLTSYGVLRQDRALLTTEKWDTIILDEAQNIKNPASQLAKSAHELQGKFRMALTGTPIENRLNDLWSQFQFVQRGLLGSREEFQGDWGLGQIKNLQRKVRPLILRRMKKDVAPELPEKTETVLYSDLTPSERSAYATILASTQEEVLQELESGGNVMHALEALLRLRQICAHPTLVPGLEEKEFIPSSKLDLLKETLEESLELGHSVLIFSQWTSFLDLVEKVLQAMEVQFVRLDGTTRNRGAVIEKFQSKEGPRVMILSLKAGGVGLTLTKADHVIILDPWWNPAVEDQAADRAHRIGQTQPVLVQRLVARDTVEERILQLQKKKKELAQIVLGQGAGENAAGLELTREDLLQLLM